MALWLTPVDQKTFQPFFSYCYFFLVSALLLVPPMITNVVKTTNDLQKRTLSTFCDARIGAKYRNFLQGIGDCMLYETILSLQS